MHKPKIVEILAASEVNIIDFCLKEGIEREGRLEYVNKS